MSTSYSFLLVSDSPCGYWRQVFGEALAALGSLQVVSESGMTALLQQRGYDVVIVDAGAVTSAPAVVSRVRTLAPGVKVVVVTVSPHWKIAKAVLQAGAADYLYKSLNKAEILAGLRAILDDARRLEHDVHIGGEQDGGSDDPVC